MAEIWSEHRLQLGDLLKIGAEAHRDHGVAVAAVGSGDIAWMAMLMLQQGGQFFGDRRVSPRSTIPYTIKAIKLLREGAPAPAPS